MELELSSISNFVVFFLIFFLFTIFILKKHAKNPKNLPPSPPSLPLIGHLHLLKESLHRTLDQMASKYGDVLLLRFGVRNVLVVSSLSAATKECFTKNDVVFSNRPRSLAGKHLNYNHRTIGFSNYNDHWRNLRRLTSLELLSTSRISMFSGTRHEEARLMVKQLFQESEQKTSSKWTKVELRPKIVDLVFNIMMKMIVGKRYCGNEIVDEEAKQFRSIVMEVTELLGSSNINDFLPVLQWIDFQGVEKRMIRVQKKMDSFAQSLVDEHKNQIIKERAISDNSDANDNHERNKTFVDVMLSLRESNPQAYDDETIKGVIQAIMIAGTDSTAITIEWAMSLLLNHPNAMEKARVEMDACVGHDRLVEELDLQNLNYLQNVINETFRLFPSVPIILPRESSEDCKVSGYDVPKGTTVLINAWTIHRDEKLWEDATSFKPERFDIDTNNHGGGGGDHNNKQLLMFGGGRRICPGALLARRVVGLALGSLIQTFEWERIGPDPVDLTEETGLSMSKIQPLEALCRPRQPMIHTLCKL